MLFSQNIKSKFRASTPAAAALVALVTVTSVVATGCQSPYHADRGALFGGLTGAGVGAVVGDALGNAGAGAAIGAGVGSLTGAAVGGSLDEIEANNRAQIAAQLGRQVQPGVVTIDDVVMMTQAGVTDSLIVTHIQHHGIAAPLQAVDLVTLKQRGVSDTVIQAMQTPPPRPAVAPQGPPVIIEEHHYGPGYWHPRPYHRFDYHHHGYRRRPCRPRTSWGFSFSG